MAEAKNTPESPGLERIARLEALAESTDKRLGTLEADLRGMRTETNSNFKEVRADARSDFRITWGGIIGGFVITWGGLIGLYLLLAAKLDGLATLVRH
jgi:hypothetical protein